MKKPKFFQCYLDNDTILAHLTDEQAGRLWKSLFQYANHDEKVKSDDPMVSLAYDFMVQQIDRDFSKYTEKCEKNKKNRNNNNDRQRPSTTVNDGDQEEEKDKEENKEKDKEEDKEEDKDNNEEENKEEDKEDDEEDDEEEIIKQAVGCDPTVYAIAHDVIDYLNSKTGSAYKHNTKATIRLIKARLKEGYTVDDFKKVIDNRVQAWGKDKQMAQYLRPPTLFSNKFESYLNCTCAEQLDYTQVFDYDEEF